MQRENRTNLLRLKEHLSGSFQLHWWSSFCTINCNPTNNHHVVSRRVKKNKIMTNATSRFVAPQLLVEAGVRANRGPGRLHLTVGLVKREPLPHHQVANHDGGGARHAGVAVDQDHTALWMEKVTSYIYISINPQYNRGKRKSAFKEWHLNIHLCRVTVQITCSNKRAHGGPRPHNITLRRNVGSTGRFTARFLGGHPWFGTFQTPQQAALVCGANLPLWFSACRTFCVVININDDVIILPPKVPVWKWLFLNCRATSWDNASGTRGILTHLSPLFSYKSLSSLFFLTFFFILHVN